VSLCGGWRPSHLDQGGLDVHLLPFLHHDRRGGGIPHLPPVFPPLARNLREIELRVAELEGEVHRLAPRIAAAANELQALKDSVARLKWLAHDDTR